jgi:hypothetical protein
MKRTAPPILAAILIAGLAAATARAQVMIPLPPFSNSYTAGMTRGFACQVPLDFTVVGLRVPDEGKQGKQNVCLYKDATIPPQYSAVVNLTPVFSKFDEPSANIIPCNVPYKKGEFVIVLGACATTIGATLYNSYAASGNFGTTILGSPTTLIRCGTQNNIATLAPPHPLWQENGGSISRVEVYIASAILAGSGSPTPGGSVTFSVSAAADAGLPYQLGSAFGPGPIPLGSRKLELSVDKLLELSVSGLAPALFRNYAGTLDASGQASAKLVIPNNTALKGTRIYSAFVTLLPSAPLGVKNISNNFLVTVM